MRTLEFVETGRLYVPSGEHHCHKKILIVEKKNLPDPSFVKNTIKSMDEFLLVDDKTVACNLLIYT